MGAPPNNNNKQPPKQNLDLKAIFSPHFALKLWYHQHMLKRTFNFYLSKSGIILDRSFIWSVVVPTHSHHMHTHTHTHKKKSCSHHVWVPPPGTSQVWGLTSGPWGRCWGQPGMSQYICAHRLVLEMHCLLCTFPATQSSLLWPAHWREKEEPHQHTCAQKWHSGNDTLKLQGVSQHASWVAEIPEGYNTLWKGHNYHTDCTRNCNYNWHTRRYFAVSLLVLHLVYVACQTPACWQTYGTGAVQAGVAVALLISHTWGTALVRDFHNALKYCRQLVQYCPLMTVNAASKIISPFLLISFLWSCITKARMVKTTNKHTHAGKWLCVQHNNIIKPKILSV